MSGRDRSRWRARPSTSRRVWCLAWSTPASAAIDPLSLLPGTLPLTRDEDGRLVGEVLWVDRFGNVQLNVDPDELAPMGDAVTLRYGDQVRTAVRATTYAELGPGQIGLVVDSY